MRSFVASRIGETQLYLQSFLERSAAGKQAAGGGNTQVDLPGSTRERLFAKHPDPRSKSGLLERRDVRFGSLADIGQPIRDVRFAPESGHCSPAAQMSAMCQKRTWIKFAGDSSGHCLPAKHQLSCRAFQARKRKPGTRPGSRVSSKLALKALRLEPVVNFRPGLILG